MDSLDLTLYWTSITVAGALVVVPAVPASFAFGAAAMLVAGPLALWLAPASAAWIALPAGLFLVAPVALGLVIERALTGGRHGLAFAACVGRTLLHPSVAERATLRFLHALWLRQRGRDDAALAALRRLEADTSVGVFASMRLAETRAEFAAIRDDPRLDGSGSVARLALLGLAGRIEAMIETYRSLLAARRSVPLRLERQRALVVLSHAGRPGGVAALRALSLESTGWRRRATWDFRVALAHLARGDAERDAALAAMRAQADSRDGVVRQRARVLLAEPPEPVTGLPAEHAAFLDRLEAAVAALPVSRRWWAVPTTLALIALNVGVFVVETVLAPGPIDNLTLYRLGALVTDDFAWPADWWRLVAEVFLHANLLHLSVNMLSLLTFGALLERRLGTVRFLALYVLSGIAANLGCLWLVGQFTTRPSLIVGASGAIMGLVGGAFGAALRQWITTRRPVFARRVVAMAILLGLQFATDHTDAHISWAAHVFGALAGTAFGLAPTFRWPAPAEAFAETVEPSPDPTRAAAAPYDPSIKPSLPRRLGPVLVVFALTASFCLLLPAA